MGLLKSWKPKMLKYNLLCQTSSFHHCPASEAVGLLTMRCSEPGGSVVVAIVASRAPGR